LNSVVLIGLLGVAQGVRHALEPDHVTAVATVMVRTPSTKRGMAYAASWGLGHGAVLVVVGGVLVGLGARLPDSVSNMLELVVGAMLVFLGIRAVRDARKNEAGALTPAPPSAASFATGLRQIRQPFMIGLVHGLAGSSALAAVVALSAATREHAIAGLILYAIGTTVGMLVLATLAGPLLARFAKKPGLANGIVRVAGVVSIAVGVVWSLKTLADLV